MASQRDSSGTSRARSLGAWLAAALVLLVAGGLEAELLVGAAVSLREPLLSVAEHFEAAHPDAVLTLSFGASSVLAHQIRAGAPIDVFVSADARLVAPLVTAGLVAPGDPRPIARNRLVVIASAQTGHAIANAADLAGPAVRRIAIPEHAVPVGRYAREWLGTHQLLERLAPRMLQTEHARATLSAVDLGHADVAIVYATDAALARSARVAFEVPLREQPHILYVAAPLAESRSLPLARRFVQFLAGDSAQRVLGAAGFASAPNSDARDGGRVE